jgi:predicted metal-dependent phosphotriesterase family hydrolase
MEEILKLAKEVLELNKQYDLAIGGSICLKMMGIDLGRNPLDIDIVSKESMLDLKLVVPEGWYQYTGRTANRAVFKNDSNYIKIEFLYSPSGSTTIIDGIKCDNLNSIIDAKKLYISKGVNSSKKHQDDLAIIEAWQEANKTT